MIYFPVSSEVLSPNWSGSSKDFSQVPWSTASLRCLINVGSYHTIFFCSEARNDFQGFCRFNFSHFCIAPPAGKAVWLVRNGLSPHPYSYRNTHHPEFFLWKILLVLLHPSVRLITR